MSIAMMIFPRFVDGLTIFTHLGQVLTKHGIAMGGFNVAVLVTHVLEYMALLLFSIVTSQQNMALHIGGFVSFLVISFVHAILLLHVQCRLNGSPPVVSLVLSSLSLSSAPSTGSRPPPAPAGPFGMRSLRYRIFFLICGLLCVVAAAFFWFYHKKCLYSYVYTGFAVSEWMVVVFNVAFHATYIQDVGDRRLVLGGEDSDH
jgi:hypothetical protein